MCTPQEPQIECQRLLLKKKPLDSGFWILARIDVMLAGANAAVSRINLVWDATAVCARDNIFSWMELKKKGGFAADVALAARTRKGRRFYTDTLTK